MTGSVHSFSANYWRSPVAQFSDGSRSWDECHLWNHSSFWLLSVAELLFFSLMLSAVPDQNNAHLQWKHTESSSLWRTYPAQLDSQAISLRILALASCNDFMRQQLYISFTSFLQWRFPFLSPYPGIQHCPQASKVKKQKQNWKKKKKWETPSWNYSWK